jgi:hypothetical protein
MSAYKGPTPPVGIDRAVPTKGPGSWKDLSDKVKAASKAVDTAVAKFPPPVPPEDAMRYVEMRPMPRFPREEVLSAKTPVEVTAIRARNSAFCHDWARVHNPGALPVDGAQQEWLLDQWHKAKKKKAADKAKLVAMAPATLLQTEKLAIERIRKENAAWLGKGSGGGGGEERAELVRAAAVKDLGRGERVLDPELLQKLLKNFKDTKESWYGLKHGALEGFLDKDPLLKGLFTHLKKPKRDPNVEFINKYLKLPATGTMAAEAAEVQKIRERNAAWLRSMGAELGGGGDGGAKQPEKRADVLAMAKKGFPYAHARDRPWLWQRPCDGPPPHTLPPLACPPLRCAALHPPRLRTRAHPHAPRALFSYAPERAHAARGRLSLMITPAPPGTTTGPLDVMYVVRVLLTTHGAIVSAESVAGSTRSPAPWARVVASLRSHRPARRPP